jgi:hypothetical protein
MWTSLFWWVMKVSQVASCSDDLFSFCNDLRDETPDHRPKLH